jgi:hypothetical protein
MIVKWPNTIAVIRQRPVQAFLVRMSSRKSFPDLTLPPVRWPWTGGRIRKSPAHTTAEMAATTRKGPSHFHSCAIFNPNGTPSAAAAENAVMMMPIPRARRSVGTTSATIAITVAPLTPPNAPHTARAHSSVAAFSASPQASVARANPA